MKLKNSLVCISVVATLASVADTAQAAVLDFEWSGLFTILSPDGRALANTSSPYYYDPTWSYGLRTQINGTMQLDTDTGYGTGSIAPFEFFDAGIAVLHDMEFQAIGDGYGGMGSLMVGRILMDWVSGNQINVGIMLDAAGLYSALMDGVNPGDVITGGVLPASNEIRNGSLPIGPAVMATTTYNTVYHNGGVFISGNDTVGGSPWITDLSLVTTSILI